MKLSDELRRRIKQLELEQERQQQELQDLEQLRDLSAIEELERELSAIEQMPANSQEVLERGARKQGINYHKGAKLGADKGELAKEREQVKDIDLSLESLGHEKEKVSQAQAGFVICLNFNADSPSEWSEEAGGGWRGQGMGTRYPTRARADAMLRSLKAKWPDYPLSIAK